MGRLQRRKTMKHHQSKVRIPKIKMLKRKTRRTRKVTIKLMKLMRLHQKRLTPSREEMRKLMMSLTKLKKKTNQLPLKLILLPKQSPLSKKSQKSLIKKSFKRLLILPKKRLNLLKSKHQRKDLRKLEKERDALDSSHLFSAHSRSNKN